jgi:formiminotetrahydrofolate cyclodeaminase
MTARASFESRLRELLAEHERHPGGSSFATLSGAAVNALPKLLRVVKASKDVDTLFGDHFDRRQDSSRRQGCSVCGVPFPCAPSRLRAALASLEDPS